MCRFQMPRIPRISPGNLHRDSHSGKKWEMDCREIEEPYVRHKSNDACSNYELLITDEYIGYSLLCIRTLYFYDVTNLLSTFLYAMFFVKLQALIWCINYQDILILISCIFIKFKKVLKTHKRINIFEN